MAITITLYNQSARLFAEGSNIAADSYKVKLYTSATFTAPNTTLASITGTEVSAGTGYTAGGKALTNVAITTVTTNDAMFDADDVIWNASGGSITAAYAVLYNATDANSPPIAFIDFGGSQSAGDTTDFKIVWSASGIFSFTVA